MPFPRFGYRLTHGPMFEKMVRKSFEEVDVDKSGSLDQKELFIALLRLYDKLNGMLPCRVTVPDLDQINKLLAEFDVDKSGTLSSDEFLKLARSLIGTRKNWRDSILLKITVAVLLKAIAFPLGGRLAKHGLVNLLGRAGLNGPNVKKFVPEGLCMMAVEAAVKPIYTP